MKWWRNLVLSIMLVPALVVAAQAKTPDLRGTWDIVVTAIDTGGNLINNNLVLVIDQQPNLPNTDTIGSLFSGTFEVSNEKLTGQIDSGGSFHFAICRWSDTDDKYYLTTTGRGTLKKTMIGLFSNDLGWTGTIVGTKRP